ncbi:MAG: cyclase family protein, partial [Saccharofermentanales bacterium]
MKIHDISMTVHSDMQVYKSRQEMRPELKITRDFDDSAARETTLCMNLHTGTHMDMPLHFIPGGATVDQLDLSRLVTACRVIDLTGVD